MRTRIDVWRTSDSFAGCEGGQAVDRRCETHERCAVRDQVNADREGNKPASRSANLADSGN